MSDKSHQKSFCYDLACGPVVKTGFHLNQYWVCKRCKLEITEALAKTIDKRTKDHSLHPLTFADDEIDLAMYGQYVPDNQNK